MADFDANLLKELREKTGMGFADCKKALAEANGDLDAAEMILRKKGLDKAAKKADRATGQGVIAIATKFPKAVIIEVQCEQDPTTQNERFQEFVAQALDAALALNEVNAENLLNATSGGKTLAEKVKELIGVIGENVVLKKAAALTAPDGGVIGQYTHFNKKAGAICAMKIGGGDGAALQTAANDVCMHAVAARPLALNRAGIPANIVAKEKEVFAEEVKNKPENIREKILEGKLGSFYGEKCLLEQVFVKAADGKTKVQDFVAQEAKTAGVSAELVDFQRLELGA
ncbi:elongation factor Ts [Planctomycetales bacterium]|nr:elongation factor Ts [Planctomycetales bacterium]